MTDTDILKAMASHGADLLLLPGGFRIKWENHSIPLSNWKIYRLLRDGRIIFAAQQRHVETDTLVFALTQKGRESVE